MSYSAKLKQARNAIGRLPDPHSVRNEI
jgi:hypothetical protein